MHVAGISWAQSIILFEKHTFTNMNPQIFEAEWDTEGVFFYQAYNNKIVDYALAHQQLGGPNFNPTRMTWIKPSFAWVLYRSGYAKKHNQERILKIKLSHHAVSGRLLTYFLK